VSITKRSRIVKVLAKREDMSTDEIMDTYGRDFEEVYNYLCSGDMWAAEETLRSEMGLEPDFIGDFI
jgi:hypothetical protein